MSGDKHQPVVDESQENAPPGYEPGSSVTHGSAAAPPLYTEGEPYGPRRIQQARRSLESLHHDFYHDESGDLETWAQYPEICSPSTKPWDERDAKEKHQAASSLFFAIDQGREDVIGFLIENNIVTPNTKWVGSRFHSEDTPLLHAVTKKNVRVVQQLLDFGADKDALGSVSQFYDHGKGYVHVLRTPLQQAASLGHLVLVKLLMEQYHCDDSIVAPDGQIALRLAAENGHQEVVDYLPPRRLGGFRRWKYAHRKPLQRATRAVRKIGAFLKVFYWYIPKFFMWEIPKDAFVKPISKSCVWCWRNRKGFGLWCKQQLLKLPERATQLGKCIGRWLAKLPQAIRYSGQACWKFGTETLPKWIRNIVAWLWKLVSERLPKALGIFARWISSVVTSSAKAIWNAILKTISFLSTVGEAVISFLRRVTLADVWSGFLEVLKTIFVSFPKRILSWIEGFGETSRQVMYVLLGTIGELLWWIGYGLGRVILHIPIQIWKILESFGEICVKLFYELGVWFNPKAV